MPKHVYINVNTKYHNIAFILKPGKINNKIEAQNLELIKPTIS